VAPVLPFGGADYFGPMAGGIALSQATLTYVLTDMIADLQRHGLSRIVVINGHGGNVGPIAEVARNVYRDSGQVVPSLYLWRIAYGLLPQLIGPEKARAVAGHGADPLTSIGLHLFPEILRKDLIPAQQSLKHDALLDLPFTNLGAASFEGAEVGMPHEYDEVYHDGVAQGDPRLSSADTGQKLTEALVGIVSRFCAHFAAKTGG
jgi:creatinine amidohydrolase